MGRLKSDQYQLFYEFHLGARVPEDHLVRKVDAALTCPGFAANLHDPTYFKIAGTGSAGKRAGRSRGNSADRTPSGPAGDAA